MIRLKNIDSDRQNNKLTIKESAKGFIQLNEMTLKRLTKGHHKDGYVILSACWQYIDSKTGHCVYFDDDTKEYLDFVTGDVVDSDDLLRGQELTTENNRRTKNLKKDIISNNFSFIPVFGGYRYDDGTEGYEDSFVVFPFDRNGNPIDIDTVVNVCKNLGEKYNQESILINKPGEAPYYYNVSDHEQTMTFSDDPEDWDINDLSKQFFTALKTYNSKKHPDYNGKPQRFTMEDVYITSQPSTIMGAHSRSLSGEFCIPMKAWNMLD